MSTFDYFIVFAEMRTGSNFLEANLNALEGVACLGEAFNPHFIGYPNRDDCLGISMAARDADPMALIAAVREAPGLNGFRYFHDHEPRILQQALEDPRCAKIVLTRNPAESYVSRKIAQATGQWKLTDVRRRKDGQAVFDAEGFEEHLQDLQGFQLHLLRALQVTGQTAFYIDYEDLQSLEVMNGLAMFLGTQARLTALDGSLKVQNPAPLEDKVENFEEMAQVLARLDRFNLARTPNFEPRRGPQVKSFVAGNAVPLIWMPLRGGPVEEVTGWLAALEGGPLTGDFSQKSLRQWKRDRPGHRSFTVLRHPLARAHAVFCSRIVAQGPGTFADMRKLLRQKFDLPLPGPAADYPVAQHRAAFLGFLAFLKANLAGQTGLRIDPHWATQTALLEGMAQFALPDQLIREEEMAQALPQLAAHVGARETGRGPGRGPVADADRPHTLASIYDAEIEARAREVYQRDYLMFGYGDWAAAG